MLFVRNVTHEMLRPLGRHRGLSVMDVFVGSTGTAYTLTDRLSGIVRSAYDGLAYKSKYCSTSVILTYTSDTSFFCRLKKYLPV